MTNQNRVKSLLFFLFPQLRYIRTTVKVVEFLRAFNRIRKERIKGKMRFPIKLGIGSAVAFVFILVVGFMLFPKMITSKVKKMTQLIPANDIRGMFIKVPFGLDFKIYVFNVTNPMDIQGGSLPVVREIGPFCYEEWKVKVDIDDDEAQDLIMYNQTDTFMPVQKAGCLTGEEEVTIPHPMILGMVNAVYRQKPGALTLVNKAIKSIYNDPPSIFVTAKVKDLLFDGVTIHCGVTDFAGKAICSQLKAEPSLRHITDDDLAFSLFGPKNGTAGKRIKALRGVKDPKDLGRIVEFDGKPNMEVWPTDQCNEIRGTDGTIFPTFLTKEEGLVSFAPDLCRSLVAQYEKDDKYDGIPVRSYFATLGDMSKNADEKCYCLTPETCLKKGLMDLYKCAGVPIYVSLPHFYESDESYLNGVYGLKPNETKHRIQILFEPTTGSPVYAKKRLQFNMPMEPIQKVDLFKTLPTTVIPLFWVEEGVELNNTWTKPLKTFFAINKGVKVGKWLILLGSLGGIGAAAFLFFKSSGKADITPVHKVKPKSSVTTIQENGYDNHAMSENEINKY